MIAGTNASRQGAKQGSKLARLVHHEAVRIDPEPLLRLRAGVDLQGAAERVGEMRDRMIDLTAEIDCESQAGGFRSVAERATRLAGIAGALGFPVLERAALNLADCARGDDGTAFAATLARMLRLSEASAAEVSVFRVFAD